MTFTIEWFHLVMIGLPLLIIEGIFSGSEIALLAADRLKLRKASQSQDSSPLRAFGSRLALYLTERTDRIFATTLLITSACVVGLSTLISIYTIQQFPTNSHIVAILITSPLVVILGEFLPKAIYQRFADRIVYLAAFPVYFAYYVLFPITSVLTFYTSRLTRLVAPLELLITGRKRTTRDELRTLISYNRKESDIRPIEKRMIRKILDFKDSDAKSALIPLVEVDAIAEGTTVEAALRAFEKHRHSRMPVYSERIDNIIGILEVHDLLRVQDLTTSIQKHIRKAVYMAETQALDDVLGDLQERKSEMTVVVDEHGGAVGILTFEDIAEEIVGEIYDEYDAEHLPYRTIGTNKWLIQARMEIDALNDSLKLQLPEGDYETLSGFLLQQFGRIPNPMDELFYDTAAGSLKFTIRHATDRHIEDVLVERIPKSE